MEQNKEIQKQIDWINVNLKREIQERYGEGARFSGTVWHLDQRVQKLENVNLLRNRRRQLHCRRLIAVMVMLGSVISIILYVVKI